MRLLRLIYAHSCGHVIRIPNTKLFPAPKLPSLQSCHEDKEGDTVLICLSKGGLPRWEPSEPQEEGKAEQPSPRRIQSSNHAWDMQVNSSHSRPPILPAQLPLKPTKRWLQRQTELSLGGSSSREVRHAVDKGGACLPAN